ncbi:hypothetical protein FWK35_00028538 [Aphis craccivora]|uniref:Uncharacterized protein n=1 Tax=Aphis craccivora TaxID=307492 RepID=A0A6G0YFI5_APHCR|nr:hypothetical protein FWK35_00028538 [Aphis craccivora]
MPSHNPIYTKNITRSWHDNCFEKKKDLKKKTLVRFSDHYFLSVAECQDELDGLYLYRSND